MNWKDLISKVRERAVETVARARKWCAEYQDRCTLDRWYYDYEEDVLIRYRDKDFKISELPSIAKPVTGERRTWAIVSRDPPPMDQYGRNAVVLYLWAKDRSFEQAFEHFSGSDNPPIDWKKWGVIGIAVVIGVYFMFASGLLGA